MAKCLLRLSTVSSMDSVNENTTLTPGLSAELLPGGR